MARLMMEIENPVIAVHSGGHKTTSAEMIEVTRIASKEGLDEVFWVGEGDGYWQGATVEGHPYNFRVEIR